VLVVCSSLTDCGFCGGSQCGLQSFLTAMGVVCALLVVIVFRQTITDSNWTICRHTNSRSVKLWTGQLLHWITRDWTIRRLVNSFTANL